MTTAKTKPNISPNVNGCPQYVSRPPHEQRAAHLENAGYVLAAEPSQTPLQNQTTQFEKYLAQRATRRALEG